MTDLIVACVWVGNKYPIEYVARLSRMVARHLPVPHRFVCLTDRPHEALYGRAPGVFFREISELGLNGWWAKMALFRTEWRQGAKVLYFDLDTVIVDDISALAALDDDEFYICANFTRAAGVKTWPCKYGSCCMIISEGALDQVWPWFNTGRSTIIDACKQYGDQMAIELRYPEASLLQDHLPAGYFLGRRNLLRYPHEPPASTKVVVFAGPLKPDNCGIGWVEREWKA